ncbi:hypothetical protein [Pedobacter africanus]|uniref:Tat (Twin-arginine translocation) pathway signal sequence n=1 Tax=Pedobacter africanus TaxID=151894 RepID=A0A1W2DFM9_9SPHI|nr:hypothetical protein [Pedobacter africanus]SMC96094.1 hypothetical protein SAMN04488524_3736 [Pedobacter africanus]
MKRRNFIKLAGLASGMVLLPPALYYVAPEVKQFAVKLLEKELHYLKLSPGSAAKFVEDYFNATGNDLLSKVKWKALYYLGYNWEKSDRIRDLIKYFLLSTDFFTNKADERKTVSYLGIYNPYTSPLSNPYSFVLYPAAEIPEPK